jgi:hypothetical protein
MRADGIGRRCGIDVPVESEDRVVVEVVEDVPHTFLGGEETKFELATRALLK